MVLGCNIPLACRAGDSFYSMQCHNVSDMLPYANGMSSQRSAWRLILMALGASAAGCLALSRRQGFVGQDDEDEEEDKDRDGFGARSSAAPDLLTRGGR